MFTTGGCTFRTGGRTFHTGGRTFRTGGRTFRTGEHRMNCINFRLVRLHLGIKNKKVSFLFCSSLDLH